ncbi:MAG TPA: response regulator transcription factor [Negativicutes bacterium]|nr:response regulator transcription factor [Negativicutes bacterium]
MKVLLAEDDVRLGRLIKHMLETEQHQVQWVVRGDEALVAATDGAFDVLVLDWMMPELSGVELCRQLRADGYAKPILMLTAKDALNDRITGLDSGADDYLVKPFEFGELYARLRALSRRGEAPLKEDVLEMGNWSLDRTHRLLRREDVEVQLSAREFQLLDLLAQNRGRVLPREVLLDRIWGLDSEVSENTLDAYIRLLRKKIDQPGDRPMISTVRGVGYKVD